MQNKIKIKVKRHFNKQIRTYHTTQQIWEEDLSFDKSDVKEGSGLVLIMMGLDLTTKKIVEELFSLNGVNRVLTSPYKTVVQLAKCFSFKDLEPQILNIIKSGFPEEEQQKIKVEHPFL